MAHRINAHGTEVTTPSSLATTQYVPYDGAAGPQRSTLSVLGDALALRPLVLSTKTGSYTLALGDAGSLILMNVASANNLTVPPNSSVAFPVGTYLSVAQINTGLTTLVQGSGVTINKESIYTLDFNGRYAMVSLIKTATDTWLATGALDLA